MLSCKVLNVSSFNQYFYHLTCQIHSYKIIHSDSSCCSGQWQGLIQNFTSVALCYMDDKQKEICIYVLKCVSREERFLLKTNHFKNRIYAFKIRILAFNKREKIIEVLSCTRNSHQQILLNNRQKREKNC